MGNEVGEEVTDLAGRLSRCEEVGEKVSQLADRLSRFEEVGKQVQVNRNRSWPIAVSDNEHHDREQSMNFRVSSYHRVAIVASVAILLLLVLGLAGGVLEW